MSNALVTYACDLRVGDRFVHWSVEPGADTKRSITCEVAGEPEPLLDGDSRPAVQVRYRNVGHDGEPGREAVLVLVQYEALTTLDPETR